MMNPTERTALADNIVAHLPEYDRDILPKTGSDWNFFTRKLIRQLDEGELSLSHIGDYAQRTREHNELLHELGLKSRMLSTYELRAALIKRFT